MDKKNLAFDRRNFILLSAGMLIVIVGFILMSGGQSDNTHFDPSSILNNAYKGGAGCLLRRLCVYDIWCCLSSER